MWRNINKSDYIIVKTAGLCIYLWSVAVLKIAGAWSSNELSQEKRQGIFFSVDQSISANALKLLRESFKVFSHFKYK